VAYAHRFLASRPRVAGAFPNCPKLCQPSAGSEQDWVRVPGPIRIVMQRSKALLVILFYVAAALEVWGLKSSEHGNFYRLAAIVAGGDVAFMFALEALFFRYGDLRSVPEHELRDA
jgi:hypothetical protein